jgi:type VI secretion system protein ImpH
MAAETGRAGADLSRRLLSEPQVFGFFQAVRLLERLLLGRRAAGERRPDRPVGQDYPPDEEGVRFRALLSLAFPASEVAGLRLPEAPDQQAVPPAEMTVAFLGLAGPCGVLPQHYTSLLLRRLRLRDTALADFLDLFNHRLTALFYRAWEKYRLPFAHERHRLDARGDEEDLPTRALYSLVGLGTAGLRGRQEVPDQAFLYYAGLFSHWPRSAVALEALLADYLELPVRIVQLQGQWLSLELEDRACMPGPACPQGRNNALAVNLVIGARVWEVQSKFRIRVGPLTWPQFRRLIPSACGLLPLCQLARSYIGPEFDFDVQGVLLPWEVPRCQLGDAGEGGFLGWNTWVRCGEFHREVDDAVFALPFV